MDAELAENVLDVALHRVEQHTSSSSEICRVDASVVIRSSTSNSRGVSALVTGRIPDSLRAPCELDEGVVRERGIGTSTRINACTSRGSASPRDLPAEAARGTREDRADATRLVVAAGDGQDA
jgi:hypothetical protein